jgi:hypothetical protein
MSANTPALPIAGFYPGTFRSGMFLYRKGRDQRAAALAKRAGGVRLNICAISLLMVMVIHACFNQISDLLDPAPETL